jgi:hypothetical protein
MKPYVAWPSTKHLLQSYAGWPARPIEGGRVAKRQEADIIRVAHGLNRALHSRVSDFLDETVFPTALRPLRGRPRKNTVTGDIASLNPRLIAATLTGVKRPRPQASRAL